MRTVARRSTMKLTTLPRFERGLLRFFGARTLPVRIYPLVAINLRAALEIRNFASRRGAMLASSAVYSR
jgi:hypothetical protein